MAKVTGIGGVFFKSTKDNKALAQWYKDHLGFDLADFGGAILNWQDDARNDGGMTVWHVAEKDTQWFAPSTSNFMINYRVDDMDGMIDQLTTADIDIISGPETHENGTFAWIMDPEGNKIELWQPKAW
ncbi:MAG: VOC family protein [Kordiimonadaceae bacterium]|jgi:predicted enzyme related to lactoylglutathione lyase|nr:VOC family protein [Kordiimonadaceae bacterium]MBT6037111.1 VOC family protein [Kordiimonadaceae bacterium]MBT6330644.1 VOC family protein [Kordiimonadaceae bacterium]MBT7582862.1 VOC family protein [Kordiimonadaceae bacterium]